MTSLRAEPIPVNGRRVEKILDLYHGVTNAKGLAERFESGSAACGVCSRSIARQLSGCRRARGLTPGEGRNTVTPVLRACLQVSHRRTAHRLPATMYLPVGTAVSSMLVCRRSLPAKIH
jgi:hypothetical protein